MFLYSIERRLVFVIFVLCLFEQEVVLVDQSQCVFLSYLLTGPVGFLSRGDGVRMGTKTLCAGR